MTRTTLVLLATLHAASALQALVLGGGFAGLYTALNLANGGVKTTLVDERERFAFLPLLYDYACGAADADEISAPFEELCRVPNLTFKRAAVTSIDFDAKSATLDDGTRIDGETLVVALGREAPEAPANARPFYRLEDATFVRETLEGWDGAARDIVVVGGGYTGVELACNLKRKRPADDVTLWDRGDALVPNAAPGNRAAAEKALGAAGVAVKLEAEYDGADADLVVWTAGSRLPPAVRGAPRACRARATGALAADAGLRVRGATNVFALGDCASVAGVAALPSAQMALQQSACAARNVRGALAGSSTLANFRFAELGEALTFGEEEASFALVPGLSDLLNVGGPTAAVARRLLYAARMPTPSQRVAALSGLGAALGGRASKARASV